MTTRALARLGVLTLVALTGAGPACRTSDGDGDGDSDGDSDVDGDVDGDSGGDGDVGEYEGDEPGECSDDADNDRDGLFDCDDPGCAGSRVCASVDGDGDDDVDEDTEGQGDADVDLDDVDADADLDVDEDVDGPTDECPDGAVLMPESIVTDLFLTAAASPYFIGDTVTVEAAATLTVEAGAEIVVCNPSGWTDPDHLMLQIDGTIEASGDPAQRITISSTTGEPGSWAGVYLESRSSSSLRYVDIIGTGATNWYSVAAAITVRELPLDVEGLHIVDSAGYGIYFEPEYCDSNPFEAVTFEGVSDCFVYCYPDYETETCLAE